MRAVTPMNNFRQQSELVSITLGLVYPFIIILGIYIILSGHSSAGGGFHGGAVLSTVYVAKYLILPEQDYMITRFQRIEKMLVLLVMLLPVTFVYMQLEQYSHFAREAYLIGLDFFIGVEVMCALSILFFRFVFYESR